MADNRKYFGKYFPHAYTQAYVWLRFMSFLNPRIYSEQLTFTVQQYGSKWIAVLSLKKKKEMGNKNIYTTLWKSSSFHLLVLCPLQIQLLSENASSYQQQ